MYPVVTGSTIIACDYKTVAATWSVSPFSGNLIKGIYTKKTPKLIVKLLLQQNIVA